MGELVFVTIEWDDPGPESARDARAFGPWPVREDGSHLGEIEAFVKRWHAAERKAGASVALWAPVPPEAYG